MDAEGLHELEVSEGDFRVKLVRQGAVVTSTRHYAPAPAVGAAPAAKKSAEPEIGHSVKSPLAGVFYRSPSPQAPPFVKEGDTVSPDKTLCIVEAMKVLNQINAGVSGKVIKILVENGKPVTNGQPLFVIDKDA
jgi:acetyl-CoA carboxylase biotin carboxyl carrier protein